MSVLLRKHPSRLEVYNDVDQEVVCFFRVLRERPGELTRAIGLTPFSRSELGLAYEPTDDDLERARRLSVRSWQGRGGPRGKWRTGWRFQRTDARNKPAVDDWHDIGHLYEVAERLKYVQIECDEALAVIRRFDTPDTLFYCDPPYPAEVRSERWGEHAYTYEMDNDAHVALARVLHEIEGMAIISSYPGEMYDELYQGWEKATKVAKTDANSQAVEAIWMSPRVSQRRLPLLALLGEKS
jgi:DNA adenine methylase